MKAGSSARNPPGPVASRARHWKVKPLHSPPTSDVAAAAPPAGSTPGEDTHPFTSMSPSRSAISAGARLMGTGTTQAPAPRRPKAAGTYARLFGLSIAMR